MHTIGCKSETKYWRNVDFVNNMCYWTDETIVEIDGLGNIIKGEPL